MTRAAIAISKKDYDRATEIYTEALSLRADAPSEAKARSFRATAHWLAKRTKDAEVDLTAAIELAGETDPMHYRERGRFYYYTDRFAESLKDYSIGSRLFPDNGAYPNGQGLALSAQGKHDEAIPRFDEAIRLDPSSAFFLIGRAEAYNRSDRQELALRDYDSALALGKLTLDNAGRLRSGRGYAYLRLKNYTAAIEEFNAAIEARPGFINALKWRALAFERLGNIDLALRDYEAVVKLHPADDMVRKRIEDLRATK
jgi:tetratricopeptide (TPR) repeat protein